MSQSYQPSAPNNSIGFQSDNDDTAPTVASLAPLEHQALGITTLGALQPLRRSDGEAFGSPFAAADAASFAAPQQITNIPQTKPQASLSDTTSHAHLLPVASSALFPMLEPQRPHFMPIPHISKQPVTAGIGMSTMPSNNPPVSNISPGELARYERNIREQQRSQRINDQIHALRDLLQESNVPIGPGHKYAVLIHVAKYMQELQSRAIVLDSEHSRLRETIRATTQVLEGTSTTTGGSMFSFNSEDEDDHEEVVAAPVPTRSSPQETMTRDDGNPDYEAIFQYCPYPLGIVSLNGVVLATNPEFERLVNPLVATTCTRNQSIFVFIQNHQELFQAMSALLEHAKPTDALPPSPPQQNALHYWHGTIQTALNQSGERIPATLTLTNTAHGHPEYFSLLVATLQSE